MAGWPLNLRRLKPTIHCHSRIAANPLFRLAHSQLTQLFQTCKGKHARTQRLAVHLAVDPDIIAIDKTGQGYRLAIQQQGSIEITGASPIGLLYGVQTLIQLCEQCADKLPFLEIKDWPDYEYRLSANWLQNCEVARWGFDRGQGLEKFIADGKRQIDLALKHKINLIYFDCSYADARTEMFPGYSRVAATLNRYARQRSIRLMTGIVTACGMINRRTYPRGRPYQCLTRIIQGQTIPDPPYGGWCWTSRQAWDIKCTKIQRYVQANEPGALYIHSIDIARFKDVAASWKTRCPQCHEAWPDDDVTSPQGMAGAYAYVDNLMLDAIFSVKNKRTGYDARRDCLVCLIAPAYGLYFQNDADWQGEIRYFEQLSRNLKYVDNVQIGIREQGFNQTNSRARVGELAARLRRNAKGHGVFVDVFAGYPGGGCTTKYPGSGFVYYRPIQPLPVIYHTFAGAATVASMEAHADYEAHTILCNNFAWNANPDGAAPLLRNYREWQNIYEGAYRGFYYPDGIYGDHGMLPAICRNLYGARAGQMIAQAYRLRSIDEDEALPLFQLEALGLMRADWKPTLAPAVHLAWRRRWERIELLTREARRLMQAGRSQEDFISSAAATVDWQIKVLILGEIMTAFLKNEAALFAKKEMPARLSRRKVCQKLLRDAHRHIHDHFPSDTLQLFRPAVKCLTASKYTPNDPILYPNNGLLSNMCLWNDLLNSFELELNNLKPANSP